MKNRKTVWSCKYSETEEGKRIIADIAAANNISEICASLLYNRGYTDPDEAYKFLNFNDIVMHSPLLLKDVRIAVERIQRALDNNEKITIYGDYDVDGVTSVTILYLYLRNLGADVGYYIPNRVGEGYGLSKDAIKHLSTLGVGLIITVDTGITAVDEVEYARTLGIDVVVTDHHECQERIPEAAAVVNPHRPDCTYPFKALAGVGVIFKVICAFEILTFYGEEDEAEAVRAMYYRFADLVAIGTIADVMPIVDENRIIVKFGLAMLEKTKRLGLTALMEAAALGSNPNVRPVVADGKPKAKPRKINSTYIGFTIAPRINAAGRISTASRAVELLLTTDEEIAELLAHELCEINYTRQIEENKIAEAAYQKIEDELDLSKQKVIVVADDDWLQGVVGIVSSKVTEKYGLPSILISFDGSAVANTPSGLDIGKGSGRSIRGFNLVEALLYSKDTLVKFGGHELAAGLSLRRKDLDAFREKINEYADRHLSEEDLYYRIEADRELLLDDVSMELANEIGKLEPFGNMNQTPNFIIRGLRVMRAQLIGSGNHSKFVFEHNGRTVNAVMFYRSYLSLGIKENDLVDVLFTLDINEFQGNRSVQLIIQDIKHSEEYISYFKDENEIYQAIRKGDPYSDGDICPTRDDFAVVYSMLRKEFRTGNDMMTEVEIYHKLRAISGCNIRLAKLKIILEVLNELKICTVREVNPGIYQYDIYFNQEKTSIDRSSILKKIKNQCIKK